MDNLEKLIYSLNIIGNISDRIDSINSSSEFMNIHNRNIEDLRILAKERNSEYFIEKINEYPKLTLSEIEEFINVKRKNSNMLLFIGGAIFGLIELLYKTAKTKGNNLGGTKNKLKQIKSINESLVYVIKNPGFEELIKSKK
jgi:hypothetical protein